MRKSQSRILGNKHRLKFRFATKIGPIFCRHCFSKDWTSFFLIQVRINCVWVIRLWNQSTICFLVSVDVENKFILFFCMWQLVREVVLKFCIHRCLILADHALRGLRENNSKNVRIAGANCGLNAFVFSKERACWFVSFDYILWTRSLCFVNRLSRRCLFLSIRFLSPS